MFLSFDFLNLFEQPSVANVSWNVIICRDLLEFKSKCEYCRNPTKCKMQLIYRLIYIKLRLYCLLRKAFVHHSSPSVVCRAEINAHWIAVSWCLYGENYWLNALHSWQYYHLLYLHWQAISFLHHPYNFLASIALLMCVCHFMHSL